MKVSNTLISNGQPTIDGIKFLEVYSDNPEILKSWFADGVMPVVGQTVDLVCTHSDDQGFCISLKVRKNEE